ncbi:3-beta-hydroxy-delta-5-C27 steroid oxidoreductase-like protein [Carp edema virus]|nr:3-beta-hydroxy-delta-5-C27 steroid oxidoreductase-like protein [Carp edema virus]
MESNTIVVEALVSRDFSDSFGSLTTISPMGSKMPSLTDISELGESGGLLSDQDISELESSFRSFIGEAEPFLSAELAQIEEDFREVKKMGESFGTKYTIGVLGGAGYLGSRVVKDLLEAFPESSIYSIDKVCNNKSPKFGFIKTDLTDPNDAFFSQDIKFNILINCAANTDPRKMDDGKLQFAINVTAVQNIINYMDNFGIKKLIHISTIDVMAPTEHQKDIHKYLEVTEEWDRDLWDQTPICEYGKTKKLAEQILIPSCASTKRDMEICILRLPGIYGEDSPILKMLFKVFDKSNGIFDCSPKETKHSRIYLGNASYAICLAVEEMLLDNVGQEIIYISDDTPKVGYHVLNRELFLLKQFKYKQLPYSVAQAAAKMNEANIFNKGDSMITVNNIKKLGYSFTIKDYNNAKRLLGYTPKFSWEQSCIATRLWISASFKTRVEIQEEREANKDVDQTALEKIREAMAEIKLSDIKIPKIRKLNISCLTPNMEDMKIPKLSDLKMPEIKMPEIKMPEIKMPKMDENSPLNKLYKRAQRLGSQ